MLWHTLIMIEHLRFLLPAFLGQEGAHHVHVTGLPWGGALRVATKHLIITIQYR